jgi:hypothetical protein
MQVPRAYGQANVAICEVAVDNGQRKGALRLDHRPDRKAPKPSNNCTCTLAMMPGNDDGAIDSLKCSSQDAVIDLLQKQRHR